MATIMRVLRNDSARLWNIGRNHMRPSGKVDPQTGEPVMVPVIVKWNNVAVRVPPVGQAVETDVRGRPLTAKIVRHLIVHHEGLSDKAPITRVEHNTQQPSVQSVASLGVDAPAAPSNPVLEEAVEELAEVETVEEVVVKPVPTVKAPSKSKK